MANALDGVVDTYETLMSQYEAVYEKATDAQKETLGEQVSVAQQNYQKALNQTLNDNNAQVAAISTQLKAANDGIKKAIGQLNDIQKVIGYVTSAVGYGSQLVSML